jgi:putative SOS response-associated peptidase YedK
MCGRFTLKTSAEALARAFGGVAADYPSPRYNIAPGMSSPRSARRRRANRLAEAGYPDSEGCSRAAAGVRRMRPARTS